MLAPSELLGPVEKYLSDLASGEAKVAVAISGGADSVALAQCLAVLCANLPSPVQVIFFHINHGLFKEAQQWTQTVQTYAQALDCECQIEYVQVKQAGRGEEDAAREARYDALVRLAKAHQVKYVFLAHHLNDHVETVLQRLFRGTGITGLQGIPGERVQEGISFVRPWLAVSRTAILAWAEQLSLHYHLPIVDDPSNLDTRYARGVLRKISPEIIQHWPSYQQHIYQLSQHAAETVDLLEELAQHDYAQVVCTHVQAPNTALNVSSLLSLSLARQKNLLRFWLARHSSLGLSAKQLNSLLLALAGDTQSGCLLAIKDYQFVRYQDRLELLQVQVLPKHDVEVVWQGEERLLIPEWQGSLAFTAHQGAGFKPDYLLGRVLSIRSHSEGEGFKQAFNRPHTSLKKVCQSLGISAIKRRYLPRLYEHERLLWMAQVGINWTFTEGLVRQDGIMLSWEADFVAAKHQELKKI